MNEITPEQAADFVPCVSAGEHQMIQRHPEDKCNVMPRFSNEEAKANINAGINTGLANVVVLARWVDSHGHTIVAALRSMGQPVCVRLADELDIMLDHIGDEALSMIENIAGVEHDDGA